MQQCAEYMHPATITILSSIIVKYLTSKSALAVIDYHAAFFASVECGYLQWLGYESTKYQFGIVQLDNE